MKFEGRLFTGDIDQVAVIMLAGNRACFDIRKLCIDPDGIEHIIGRKHNGKQVMKCLVIKIAVDCFYKIGNKTGVAGEGSMAIIANNGT